MKSMTVLKNEAEFIQLHPAILWISSQCLKIKALGGKKKKSIKLNLKSGKQPHNYRISITADIKGFQTFKS